MAPPRTLPNDEPFNDVDKELLHTFLFLVAFAPTQALAATFQQLRSEVEAARKVEAALVEAVLAVQARAVFADDKLNALSDRAKTAVLAESNNDYQAPLYRRLFEGQSPSAFRRPVLGSQLTSMRTWVAPLSAQTNTELKGIGVELGPVVMECDDIVSSIALAEQKLDEFMQGPRAALIGKINGARSSTFGTLREMVQAPGGEKLPSDFAERFFLRGSSKAAPTIDDLQADIERTKAKLARQEAQLAEMKEKEAKQIKAQQEAELAERRLKLEAAQKKAAEAAAELAKLEAEMNQSK